MLQNTKRLYIRTTSLAISESLTLMLAELLLEYYHVFPELSVILLIFTDISYHMADI